MIPSQLSLFDRQAAIAGRDHGMHSVHQNAGAWSIRAAHALRRCAQDHPDFIVDDVWRYMDPADVPHDGRAMGPILMTAARQGLILNTRRIRLSDRSTSHRNPRPIWQSLIYRTQAA
jgi:hypothetical protein